MDESRINVLGSMISSPFNVCNYFPAVVAQTCPAPRYDGLRRGFHRAALLRLADDSKSDPTEPPLSHHDHFQAHEGSSSSSTGQTFASDSSPQHEDPQPNTRLDHLSQFPPLVLFDSE